jgi:UDP-N-acetylmuramyl tripeptide synthase
VTASTGDNGYQGGSFPSSSQYVTAVGGTTLAPASNSRGWTESAWSGAGSGCSTVNAALAAAAASLWDVPAAKAFEAMERIPSVEGRYLETSFAGRPLRLLLAKNPAGWVEALGMTRPDAPVVVAVNARAADGRDPSWLWDVPFEVLRGRHAVATGERSRDVAVRLRYAGVEHVRVDDLAAALRAAQGARPIEVLANYTAFQAYRRVVRDG